VYFSSKIDLIVEVDLSRDLETIIKAAEDSTISISSLDSQASESEIFFKKSGISQHLASELSEHKANILYSRLNLCGDPRGDKVSVEKGLSYLRMSSTSPLRQCSLIVAKEGKPFHESSKSVCRRTRKRGARREIKDEVFPSRNIREKISLISIAEPRLFLARHMGHEEIRDLRKRCRYLSGDNLGGRGWFTSKLYPRFNQVITLTSGCVSLSHFDQIVVNRKHGKDVFKRLEGLGLKVIDQKRFTKEYRPRRSEAMLNNS